MRIKALFAQASEEPHASELVNAAPASVAAVVRQMLVADGLHDSLEVRESLSEAGAQRWSKARFATGEIVAGRFEIVRFLGRGGMGEVYEARDQVKNQAVALKVLLANGAIDSKTADSLLRREVFLAQLVSHRNVCRLYDLYVHKDEQGSSPTLAISMELLRGRTLAAILEEHKKLAVEEVEEIARQMAAGIDAAHAAEVIHRDLKPSNIMLAREEGQYRAVVTDFGLARPFAAPSTTQPSTTVAGTLRYMAPEQLEGRADKRSDLYSFALILYELLTGELPFTGDTDFSIALNRLSLAPRDPGTLVPGLSLKWRAALLRALSREPQQRFQSAAEMINAVEKPTNAGMLWSRIVGSRVRSVSWQAKVAALAILVSAVILAAALFKPKPDSFPPFSRLLVTDLKHKDTDDVPLLGASAGLLASIGQSPHLTLVRPSELRGTLARMGIKPESADSDETLRQVAMRTGESAILSGTISKNGGYALHLKLQTVGGDPRHARRVVQEDFEAKDSTELLTSIAAGANWLRKLSGEGRRDLNEQNAKLEDLTTGSWQALRLLQEARARRAADDPSGALIFANEALDLDPEFAAAEAFSADVHTDLRQYKEAFRSYQRALDFAKRRNVTGRERYQIEAAFNTDAGNDENSRETYRAWSAHFPQDQLPHFYQGFLLLHRGEYPEALAEMQRARDLAPMRYLVLPHLAAAYLANNKFQEARECATRLRELGQNDWALEVDGLILLAEHRFNEAAETVKPLASRKDGVFSSVGPRYVASAYAASGRLHDAEEQLLRADIDTESNSAARVADRQLEIAYLRWLQGDDKGVRSIIGSLVKSLDNPESLSLLGSLCARVGELKAARGVLSQLDQWPEVPIVAGAYHRVKAEIALGSHKPAGASYRANPVRGDLSPLELEFLLHEAKVAGESGRVEELGKTILLRKDILLSWDERQAPPGLYWLAACMVDRTQK